MAFVQVAVVLEPAAAFGRLDRLLPIGPRAEGVPRYTYANLHFVSKLFV